MGDTDDDDARYPYTPQYNVNPNPSPFRRPKLPLRTPPYNNQSHHVKPLFDPPHHWSETATLILIDSWWEKFMQSGRRNLRADQWVDIAKRVSASTKTFTTDAHCRHRFETLKKKYKRETLKQSRGFGVSKWAYFNRMDSLVGPTQCHVGLPCGVDGGEYVFLDPRVCLGQTNYDEFCDSPAENDNDDDDLDGGVKRFRGSDDEDCFRVLADSIKRFGEIYERIESNKRQGMEELEKMRKEIDRDLEAQKRGILEQTKVALAQIRRGGENGNHDDDDDNNDDIDASVTNMSG